MDFFKIFFGFFVFFGFYGFLTKLLRVLLQVTKVANGNQKWPKMGQNSIIKSFFCPKGKQSLGQSPLQELEVGSRSGSYLLVLLKIIEPLHPFKASKLKIYRIFSFPRRF